MPRHIPRRNRNHDRRLHGRAHRGRRHRHWSRGRRTRIIMQLIKQNSRRQQGKHPAGNRLLLILCVHPHRGLPPPVVAPSAASTAASPFGPTTSFCELSSPLGGRRYVVRCSRRPTVPLCCPVNVTPLLRKNILSRSNAFTNSTRGR